MYIYLRCDNVTQFLDDTTGEKQLKDDHVLVKIYFKRMESHLQSFGKRYNLLFLDFTKKIFSERTIDALDRFDKSSIENIS